VHRVCDGLVDGVFQRFAGFEPGHFCGLDFNGLSGLGVTACPGRAVADFERAESNKRDRLFLFQTCADGVQGAIDRSSSGSF